MGVGKADDFSTTARQIALEKWARKNAGDGADISPLSGDASFRRYYRARIGKRSFVVMDAPPPQESAAQFIRVRNTLAKCGIHFPAIFAADRKRGFLLLSDFGDEDYCARLTKSPKEADSLYSDAIRALIKMQKATRPNALPPYSARLLFREMSLFPRWHLDRFLQRKKLNNDEHNILSDAFGFLIRAAMAQPKVFVHRDYHSRNLMMCEPNPGILDFQDAVIGAITYDLASLFRDAYISWDEKQTREWILQYWNLAKEGGGIPLGNANDFLRDFDFMTAQRCLKVLGIFSRLYLRDGKSDYLQYLPTVMNYLIAACRRQRELHPLLKLLEQVREEKIK